MVSMAFLRRGHEKCQAQRGDRASISATRSACCSRRVAATPQPHPPAAGRNKLDRRTFKCLSDCPSAPSSMKANWPKLEFDKDDQATQHRAARPPRCDKRGDPRLLSEGVDLVLGTPE